MNGQSPSTLSLPFRPSVVAGGLIYLSGVLAADAQRRVTGDIRQQTRTVLDRVNATLAQHGRTLHDAVSITVYLKHPEDFAAMNEVYKTYVGEAPAARTTVAANLVVPEALIEVAVVAAAPGTSRRVLHPEAWQRSPNPYSYAVEAGNTIFLSGLIARNPVDNSAVPGDMAAQSKTVLENARTLLKTAGLDFDSVVAARVYITDLGQFEAMNQVYRSYFTSAPPARATARVSLTSPANLVEMTFVASRTPKEVILGDGAPNPNLSAAIRAGGRLYVSGMLGVTPGGTGDVAAQTRETLTRIGRTLAGAGFSWSDVAENVVYLSDTRQFGSMNEAYRAVVPAPYPARTTVEAGLAARDGLVEIMTTAVKK